MATAADYVGKNCPYCGAVDSIETDEARGEAACTNCATVIAMGLEENVATRWEKEATFADVDRDDTWDPENPSGDVGRARAKNAGLTREEAAAQAAGLLRRPASGAAASGSFFDTTTYEKTRLHPRQSRVIETLFRLSRRQDEKILQEAFALAKRFVGRRRERSVRVEHQSEVAAACLMLAAEHHNQPIPLGELRVLDPSLKDVETPRQEIIDEGNLRAEVAQLEKKHVPNLVHYYLQLLQLPLVRYEQACLALVKAIQNCEVKPDAGASELALLVEAEKVVMAVLLARTDASLQWEGKPAMTAAAAAAGSVPSTSPNDPPSGEPPATTLYTSFAATAHLQPQRVLRIMKLAHKLHDMIAKEFDVVKLRPEFASTAVKRVGTSVPLNETTGVPHSGVKRPRNISPAATSAQPSQKPR